MHDETEYEQYIRTTPLLRLQKSPEELACHDELAFQIVHQVAELWMKLALEELGLAERHIDADRLEEARTTLFRMWLLVDLLGQNFRVLETMSPKAYFTVRQQLGRGSGQESPGFNRLLDNAGRLRSALNRLLRRRGADLLALHRDPTTDPALFALTEALVDFDEGFQIFRFRHLALVKRIIGGRTPSLKGAPAELLAHGVQHAFFPELWLVREALFREYVPGPSLYGDDEPGSPPGGGEEG
ncbi:MAG: tryptophan 2,3-dioxygenase family protein [bacterium]